MFPSTIFIHKYAYLKQHSIAASQLKCNLKAEGVTCNNGSHLDLNNSDNNMVLSEYMQRWVEHEINDLSGAQVAGAGITMLDCIWKIY